MLTKYKLEIELVPKSSWYNNLRQIMSEDKWRNLSRFVREDGVCDICGRHLPMNRLDAHEQWSYHDDTYVQKLEDILSLCKDCHRVKHIGRAQAVGEEEQAKAWFMAVNGCSEEDYDRAMRKAFTEWKERSCHEWTLDISLVDSFLPSGQAG